MTTVADLIDSLQTVCKIYGISEYRNVVISENIVGSSLFARWDDRLQAIVIDAYTQDQLIYYDYPGGEEDRKRREG